LNLDFQFSARYDERILEHQVFLKEDTLSEIQECEFLEKCPMFALFEIESMGSAFISLYCKGPLMDSCERGTIRRSGKTPPDDLLPDGNSLK
jgi:hypothetical protein